MSNIIFLSKISTYNENFSLQEIALIVSIITLLLSLLTFLTYIFSPIIRYLVDKKKYGKAMSDLIKNIEIALEKGDIEENWNLQLDTLSSHKPNIVTPEIKMFVESRMHLATNLMFSHAGYININLYSKGNPKEILKFNVLKQFVFDAENEMINLLSENFSDEALRNFETLSIERITKLKESKLSKFENINSFFNS